jgi:hypothetical protein
MATELPLEFEEAANRMFGVEELYLDILRFGCLRVSDVLLITHSFMIFHFNLLVLKNLMSTCHWVDSNLLHIIGVRHIFRTQLRIVSFFPSSTN